MRVALYHLRIYHGTIVGKEVHLRSEADVGDLLALAHAGDTLHKLEEGQDWTTQELLDLIAGQLERGECIRV